MLVLLDTHALIWLDQDAAALGETARHRVDEALRIGELLVSAISFWETASSYAPPTARGTTDSTPPYEGAPDQVSPLRREAPYQVSPLRRGRLRGG